MQLAFLLKPARPRACHWLAAAALLLGLAFAHDAAWAQPRPGRDDGGAASLKRMLWVGNSFFYSNNSMHSHVEALAKAADPASGLQGVSATISGSALGWHDLDAYFRPGAIGSFAFTADNDIVFATRPPPIDVVVMMDCSQCPIHPRLTAQFHASVRSQSQAAARHGARPVLFMSWAYADRPEMTAALAEQYTRAGHANDAQVIPAGLAFAKALARRPDIGLYQTDLRHPSFRGTYLAACTAYAALLGQSPVGNAYTAGLSTEIATFLQAVAWDTVREYRAQAAARRPGVPHDRPDAAPWR